MAYIPSPQDLLWTLQNIQSNSMWAVPSGGSVSSFRHEEFGVQTFTVAGKNGCADAILQSGFNESIVTGLP